ncbi:MAG: PdxA family protein [Candidatus Melainabacteria bacterium]
MTPVSESPPTVCLTIGDADGIGPEIAVKFLTSPAFSQYVDADWRVFGDIASLRLTAERLGKSLPELDYCETGSMAGGDLPGVISYRAIEAAVSDIHRLLHAGGQAVMVTGPIAKEQLAREGYAATGHTEILQDLANQYWSPENGRAYQSDMLFVHGPFRLLLLTRHVPLRDVSRTLTVRGVRQSLNTLVAFLVRHAGIPAPRIAMLGVNPHAGEIVADGVPNEEETILKPAMAAVKDYWQGEGVAVAFSGPLPADAFFRGFDAGKPPADAVVATYHDQGLIPFKLLAGMAAVNVTVGLPFLRTSVSHGTAQDIAGKGIADTASLEAAVSAALTLMSHERQKKDHQSATAGD